MSPLPHLPDHDSSLFAHFDFQHLFHAQNYICTKQNYKRITFVFAPIFHELNSKI